MKPLQVSTLALFTTAIVGTGSVQSAPYVGIGVGASRIDLNTRIPSLIVRRTQTTAYQLTGGLPLSNGWSFETRLASLGDVEFTNQQNLAYQVLDVTALRHWYHSRWTVFGRAGVARLFTQDSTADAVRINDYHLALGAGIGFAVTPGLSVRAELNAHASDLQSAQLNVMYHFGQPARFSDGGMGERVAARLAAEPEQGDPLQDTATVSVLPNDDSEPAPNLAAAEIAGLSAAVSDDSDAEVSTSESELEEGGVQAMEPAAELTVAPLVQSEQRETATGPECPEPQSFDPVAESGCPLFGAPLPDIQFLQGSNTLTETARETLNRVAIALESVPEANVTVIVHMADGSDPDLARVVSRRRALTILRFLSDKGVDASRIRPEGRGVAEPLAGATTADRRNERVVMILR